jgi:pimeloyl-ACP methyl ester carboxylesterase
MKHWHHKEIIFTKQYPLISRYFGMWQKIVHSKPAKCNNYYWFYNSKLFGEIGFVRFNFFWYWISVVGWSPFYDICNIYFINNIWLKSNNQILDDVHKIRHIPTEIVHGRYDMVCPVENAYDLKQAFPEATLHITPDAGHAAKEPGNLSKLIEITERFKTLK